MKRILFCSESNEVPEFFLRGVEPAYHILEFFKIESSLKDAISGVKVCNPDCMYKPEKAILHLKMSVSYRLKMLLISNGLESLYLIVISVKKLLPKKIYISRRDSPASRAIINENKLIQFLKKQDYQILRFDQLTLIEKLTAIKGSKEKNCRIRIRRTVSQSFSTQQQNTDNYKR